jgi:radical SAM protein with 4Fe4S-binding SPASM domain
MGIESNGDVKGCPSLQTRHYVGGNLREQSLAAIWKDTPELGFNRARTVDDLWGFCRTCDFAAECLGGCTFTAHSILGRPGNNPYCHYRARVHAKRGQRERLVPGAAADGLPFDNGVFDIVVEPLEAADPDAAVTDLVQITRRAARRSETA